MSRVPSIPFHVVPVSDQIILKRDIDIGHLIYPNLLSLFVDVTAFSLVKLDLQVVVVRQVVDDRLLRKSVELPRERFLPPR